MPVIESKVDLASAEAQANGQAWAELRGELLERRAVAALGGNERSRERHVARGKLLPRERVLRLLDPGSPFLEIGSLAAYGMYEGDVHGAGMIAGIGRVAGRECVIVCNDATIKGGTYYPMTVKKHLRAQEIARENRLPCLYLVDSGGANLPHQTEVFPDREHFGRIFYNQATLSAEAIPQIAVVMGSCTAGGAYVPAMSDETVIVKKQGTIFLGGPPLVKAATGEVVSAEDLGGADVHARLSGVADHLRRRRHPCAGHRAAHRRQSQQRQAARHRHRGSRRAAIRSRRARGRRPDRSQEAVRHPRGDRPACRRLGVRRVQEALRHDAGHRLRPHITASPSASSPTTASCSRRARSKGAHFIELCCQRRIPLLFLQNITGFMVGRDVETRGIAKDGAKLVTAVASARVPKITVLVGGSFGAGNYGMCGRAYSPRFLFSWPNSRVSVMGHEQASSVLATVRRDNIEAEGKSWSAEEEEAFKKPIRDKIEAEGSPYYATARLWDDGIILPSETRRVLALAFSACLNAPVPETKFGVFRM